ncbi:MAG: AsmA family protein [Beijerinckiaceae bacterium]
MRDLLTGLAILLLLCLTGALIAPHFIDWDSRKPQISSLISEAVGYPVSVNGPIRITLLPVPGLKLSHVAFADPSGVSGQVARLKLAAAIPPLLRGEIRITSASVNGARLVLKQQAGAAERATGSPPQSAWFSQIGFQDIALSNSSLRVLGPDGTTTFDASDVEGQLEATTLSGPFRGTLAFSKEGNRQSLRFSTGPLEVAGIRLKALLENETAAHRGEFDGVVKYTNGAFAGEGKIAASGNGAIPGNEEAGQIIWRMAAKAKGSSRSTIFDDIELTLGNGERQAVFTGNGDVDLERATPARITLATRQLDLDRLLGEQSSSLPRTPQAVMAALAAAGSARSTAKSASDSSRPAGEIDVTIGSILIGQDVIVGARVVLESRDGTISLKQAAGEFPGRSILALAPAASASDPLVIDQPATRDIKVESQDIAKFLGWYQGVPPRPVGIRSLRMEGRLQQMQNGFGITQASMTLDEMKLSGSLTLQDGKPKPKLILRLTADQLDIAKFPDISDIGGDSLTDLDLAVDAERMRFSGLGAGRIQLRLRREDTTLFLDQLAITDLGGADLVAAGELGPERSSLKADLDARNLQALLALTDRLTSHAALPYLVTRAKALSPAKISVAVESERPGSQGSGLRVSFKGALNETKVNGWTRLKNDGELQAGQALDVELQNPSAASLFRQIGMETITIKSAGGAALHLKGGGLGEREKSVDWSLKGELVGTKLDISAKHGHDGAQPVSGTLAVSALDLAPLAQSLLIAVPLVQPGQPLDLKAGFDLRGYKITLRDMDMKFGGGYVRGEIAFNLLEFGRVAGQLKTGPLDVASFSPLIFGESNAPPTAGLWASTPFGVPAPITLPGDLWIEAERVDLLDGLSIEKPSFVLRFESGLIYLENAQGEWGGGRLKGNATLRRADKSVSITGRLGLKDLELDQGLSARAFQGRASSELEFSAIGTSPLGLVSGLSGTGRLDLRQALVKGLKTDALDAVVNAPQGDFALVNPEVVASSLAGKLSGALQLPGETMPVALAAGVLRAGPVSVSSGKEEIVGSLGLDLKAMSLSGQAAIRLRNSPKGWTGPMPRAVVTWQGPLANPVLKVDAAALANGMSALAIARETERIEALEQDQRERAAFNRRLQASREEQRRLEEDRRRLEAVQRANEERRRQERLQQELAKQEAIRQDVLKQEALRQNALRLRNIDSLRLQPETVPPGSIAPPAPLVITPPAAR